MVLGPRHLVFCPVPNHQIMPVATKKVSLLRKVGDNVKRLFEIALPLSNHPVCYSSARFDHAVLPIDSSSPMSKCRNVKNCTFASFFLSYCCVDRLNGPTASSLSYTPCEGIQAVQIRVLSSPLVDVGF